MATITALYRCAHCGELNQVDDASAIPNPDPSRFKLLAEWRAELLAEGYRQGNYPDADPECLALDRAACTESACEVCGSQGCAYVPFVRHYSPGSDYPRPRSYRPLCACLACGLAWEF